MARPHQVLQAHPSARLIGDSPAIRALQAQIRHLAGFDTVGNPYVPTLLLQGETGTGKGLVARVIHDSGPRAQGPFIEVNCAAIPETLLEAELFGFEAGTFTDAKRAKPGLFEAASGGTLFLDEVAALPLLLQAKFLKTLEEKRVRRLGAVADQGVDVKLIAATQEELSGLVREGRFRADLYHRLAVVLLAVPLLRERGEDMLVLGQHFLHRYAAAHGLIPKRLSRAAEVWLRSYAWPGNVRELSHLMERVTLLSPETILAPHTLEQLCLPPLVPLTRQEPEAASDARAPLDEPARIRQTLLWTEGNVVRAARLLGLSRNALRHRMRQYGIERPSGAELARARQAFTADLPPSPTQGRGGPEGATARQAEGRVLPMRAPAPAQPPGWEQKPVAVLAITLTWPETTEGEAPRYDPWTVAARWEQTIVEKVQGFGGVLVQHAASLLTAVFGMPRTLEQLPQRAVQAALVIRHLGAEARAAEGGEPAPEVRQAVHWGAVLVDVQTSDPTGRVLAVGETLALPVRLLGHAAPGDLLVSPQVGRLVEGWFEVQAREISLGGEPPERLVAYSVRGLEPRRFSRARLAARTLSRFVGRERELAALGGIVGQAEGGQGQVVAMVGEPGIGKSRLLYEFRQSLTGRQVTYLEGHCLSYGSTIPYLPVLDLLKAYFRIEDRDDGQRVREKVTGTLLSLDEALGPTLPAFLALLDDPVDDPQWQALDPPQRRQRTLEAVKRLLLRESQAQPLLLVFENLHWVDAETQVFLDSLVESLPTAHILLLVTSRPEYQHGWGNRTYYTQLRLDPLPRDRARELLDALLGDAAGLEPLKQRLIDRTQGNPFFLEESVQTLVETRILVGERGAYRLAQALPSIQVPATVQAVLAARIDRLPLEEKRLLQAAAVIGKHIPFALLHAVAECSEAALRRGLTHLQAAEFLYETSLFPELEYTFKHALTHEVAYASLPQERRHALHARIVEGIERLSPDRLADQVERLADHAFRGEVWDKAVTYFWQAGVKAFSRSANREAVACFEQALVALQHLPESLETRAQAIDLRSHLCNALVPLGEFRRILDRLREAEPLAEALADQQRLGRVSSFMTFCVFMMGDHDRAVAFGQRALGITQALGDFPLQVRTNFYLGQAYHDLGDYRRAMDVLRRTIAALEGELMRKRLGMAGLPSVFVRTWLVWCLAELGAFAEGMARGEEGVRIAEAVDHPFSMIVAYCGVGVLSLRKGDLHQAIAVLERGLGVCQDSHIPLMFPWVASALGAAYALAGRVAEALPLLEQAVEQAASKDIMGRQALQLAWLGEAKRLAGHLEEASTLAERALERALKQKERGHQAWALRLLGEIAVQREPPEVEQAKASYRRALALADELGMRPLVGHCHLGLGTLYARIGQRELACAELAAASELYRAMEMMFWLSRATGVFKKMS